MTQPPDTQSALDRLEDKIDWLIEANGSAQRVLGRVRWYLLALACVSIVLAAGIVVLNARHQAEISDLFRQIEQTGQETADTVLRNLPVPDTVAAPVLPGAMPHPTAPDSYYVPQPPAGTVAPFGSPVTRPLDLRAPPAR